MNETSQRYKGFHPYKMDPKFRVSIPPLWRPVAGEPLFLLYSTQHDMSLVRVLSQEAYAEKVALIRGSDEMTPKEKSDMLGTLAMLSHEASLNDQGKLLVPKDLSEKAGITAESEVMLVGRGNFFQIWNRSTFEGVIDIEANFYTGKDKLGIF